VLRQPERMELFRKIIRTNSFFWYLYDGFRFFYIEKIFRKQRFKKEIALLEKNNFNNYQQNYSFQKV